MFNKFCGPTLQAISKKIGLPLNFSSCQIEQPILPINKLPLKNQAFTNSLYRNNSLSVRNNTSNIIGNTKLYHPFSFQSNLLYRMPLQSSVNFFFSKSKKSMKKNKKLIYIAQMLKSFSEQHQLRQAIEYITKDKQLQSLKIGQLKILKRKIRKNKHIQKNIEYYGKKQSLAQICLDWQIISKSSKKNKVVTLKTRKQGARVKKNKKQSHSRSIENIKFRSKMKQTQATKFRTAGSISRKNHCLSTSFRKGAQSWRGGILFYIVEELQDGNIKKIWLIPYERKTQKKNVDTKKKIQKMKHLLILLRYFFSIPKCLQIAVLQLFHTKVQIDNQELASIISKSNIMRKSLEIISLNVTQSSNTGDLILNSLIYLSWQHVVYLQSNLFFHFYEFLTFFTILFCL